jgi:uncharacterized C2H2 Zn-finger protein
MNLALLGAMQRYAGMQLSDITAENAAEIAGAFGYEISKPMVDDLLNLLKAENDQALIDWVINADNLERFKAALIRNREAQTFLVACPNCSKITVKSAMTIAAHEPHVICNHCKEVIALDA